MIYDDYFKIKKILAYLRSKISTINRDISIRDIFVYSWYEVDSHGEHGDQSKYSKRSPDFLMRLSKNVEFLANVANEYHQKSYCEKNENGIYSIKVDALNKITRILLSEFWLYSARPMTINEFSIFFKMVEEIAKKQHENVHLLLSTFSVLTDDKKLLDMSLYVECGGEPKIQTFCKGRADRIDPQYLSQDSSGSRDKIANFSQQEQSDFLCNISEHVASKEGEIISSASVFRVQTKGGAQYTQAIDVCADYSFKHSIKILEKIFQFNADNDTRLIPRQVDHILTSNSIDLNKKEIIKNGANIAKFITQIDPYVKMPHCSSDALPAMNDLVKHIDNSNTDMAVSQVEKQGLVAFLIKNPSFGPDYQIIASEERKLQEFNGNLKTRIDVKNKKTENFYLKNTLANLGGLRDKEACLEIFDKADDLFDQLKILHELLIKECSLNFLEETFKSTTCKLKLKAKEIILESFRRSNVLYLKDSAYFMHHIDMLLADLRLNIQYINGSFSNGLLINLEKIISQFEKTIPQMKFEDLTVNSKVNL